MVKTEHLALAALGYLFLTKNKGLGQFLGTSGGGQITPAETYFVEYPDSGLIAGSGSEQTTEQSEIPQYWVDPQTGVTETFSPFEEPTAAAKAAIGASTGAAYISGRGFVSIADTIKRNAAEAQQRVAEQFEQPVQGKSVAETFPNLPPAEEIAIASAAALPFVPFPLKIPLIGGTAIYEVATQMTPQAVVDTSIAVAQQAAQIAVPVLRPAVQVFDLFKGFFGWK